MAVQCRAAAHGDSAAWELPRISDSVEPVLHARSSKAAASLSGPDAEATVATRSATQKVGSEVDEEAKAVSVMSGAWLSNHMKTITVFGQGLGWVGIAVGAFFWIRCAAADSADALSVAAAGKDDIIT